MGPVAVLSPHLDDAVFSCWHLLASARDVVVINVFTAIPRGGTKAPRWDRITGADDPEAGCGSGWKRTRRRWPWRAGAPRTSASWTPITATSHRAASSRPSGSDCAPAAIGGHSDHELVRDVGLALAAEGRDVSFYGDLPYSTAFGWPAWVTGNEGDPFLDVDAYWALHVPDRSEEHTSELQSR